MTRLRCTNRCMRSFDLVSHHKLVEIPSLAMSANSQIKAEDRWVAYLLRGLLPAVTLVAEGALELFVVWGRALSRLLLLVLMLMLLLLLNLGRRLDRYLCLHCQGRAHKAALPVDVLDAHLRIVMMSKLYIKVALMPLTGSD